MLSSCHYIIPFTERRYCNLTVTSPEARTQILLHSSGNADFIFLYFFSHFSFVLYFILQKSVNKKYDPWLPFDLQNTLPLMHGCLQKQEVDATLSLSSANDWKPESHMQNHFSYNSFLILRVCACWVRPPISLCCLSGSGGEQTLTMLPLSPLMPRLSFITASCLSLGLVKCEARRSHRNIYNIEYADKHRISLMLEVWGQRSQSKITLYSFRPPKALEVLNSRGNVWVTIWKSVTMK